MTGIDTLEQKLKNIFGKPEALVVMICGKWGVGKTYFWHKFINKQEGKKAAYISLFGKDTIQAIRADISIRVSKRNYWLAWLARITGMVKLPYVNLSLLLSLLSKKDFKNIIICFDDFERLSQTIDLKDVLGLIAELKEQKECKVVMILNQEKLQDEKDDLSTYKDKTIDYEFQYSPTPSESFRLIQDELKVFRSYPIEDYFQRKNVNNIRIMRKVIHALNDFAFVEETINGHEALTRDIVGSIIEISAINAQFWNFEKLSEYALKKFRATYDKPDPTDPQPSTENDAREYDDLLSLIDGHPNTVREFLESKIAKCIMAYCKTSIVDKEKMNEIIKDKMNNEEIYELDSRLKDNHTRHLFDMNYKNEEYVHELWDIMRTNPDRIVSSSHNYLTPGSFIFHINELKEIDERNKNRYHDFAVERLKKFLDKNFTQFDPFHQIETIKNFDPALSNHCDHPEATRQQKITSVEQAIELMRNLSRKSSRGNEPDILAQIPKETIERYIMENPKFFELACDCLIRFKNAESGMGQYTGKLIDVLKNIESTSPAENHKRKIQKFLERLKNS